MAITLDAVSSVSATSGVPVTSLTVSHTVGSGSNTVLVVGVGIVEAPTTSSVTYAGAGLTQIRADHNGPPANISTSVWWIVGPATGANNVVATISAASDRWAVGVCSFFGVSGAAADASNGATGTSTTPNVSVTTVADNAWLLSVTGTKTITLSVTAPQVQRWNFDEGTAKATAGGTTGPVSPPAATSMAWSTPASAAWAITAASFAPAGAAVVAHLLALTGAGPG